jgi:D-aminopeptidase
MMEGDANAAGSAPLFPIHATLAMRLPGVNSVSPTTVRYKAEDYMSTYNAFLCMTALSESFSEGA